MAHFLSAGEIERLHFGLLITQEQYPGLISAQSNPNAEIVGGLWAQPQKPFEGQHLRSNNQPFRDFLSVNLNVRKLLLEPQKRLPHLLHRLRAIFWLSANTIYNGFL